MTSPRLRHPFARTVAAIATAAVVLAVACDGPRPEPAAPEASPDQAADTPLPMFDFQVDAQAMPLPGNRAPRYPKILQSANVEGTVLATFIVDENGIPDSASIRLLESSHQLFSEAVRAHIPTLRFSPARSDGKAVRMWIQQPFTFRIGR